MYALILTLLYRSYYRLLYLPNTFVSLILFQKHRPLADQDEMVELEAIPGWEVDRLEYNAAMASPAAPGSLLVGLHGGDSVFLGVQKDQIVRVDKCKIRNGKHDEILSIVRENDHLVVVEAKRGVMFTGDFPHAGVRNFPADSNEQQLMDPRDSLTTLPSLYE